MRTLFIIFISLTSIISIKAQEVKFTVEVSSDSILMGNYFTVTFNIENGKAQHFDAPNFQGFSITSGPNQSSSFSMYNGVTSQSMSYTYYLEPLEEGEFFIEPANIEVDGQILETAPIKIKVAPNPEGIIQRPNQQKNRTFDSFFDQPLFPKKDKAKPKKKRKIYRI